MTNIILNTATRKCNPDKYFLGYEGENNINKLIFKFEDGFRDGLGILNIKREEETGYLDLTKVGDTYELEVKSALLSKIGEITFQFTVNEPDGTVIKYDAFTMVVKDSIDADAEMPEDYPNWIDMANAKLAEVDAAITNTEAAAENATNVADELLRAKENGEFDGQDGQKGEKGADGFSPIANVTQTDDGAIISITDTKGTTTAVVKNGKDGEKGDTGASGENGLTPYIGGNGNWWIGDTDTGVNPGGPGSGSGDSTPVGNIISFMGTIAPSGYLICDGAEINISDYPKLATHFEIQFGSKNHFGGDGTTTFAIPDLRNEFLRGFGDLSGEIGIHQDGTSHPYMGSDDSGKVYHHGSYNPSKVDEVLTTATNGYTISSSATTWNANGKVRSFSSRPTNVAVLYCIKY